MTDQEIARMRRYQMKGTRKMSDAEIAEYQHLLAMYISTFPPRTQESL